MILKRLDIHGFKTFAEKTTLVFESGITCIVGPNGSGKSNIAEAILWVLGENNVRSLRGSAAQDVIFAGNERRRPLGMAEVSLTLDNSARTLPLDFNEITVTRRLYRSGESEFFINRVACRLKDIYELFLDTGVGRDAYSMIHQGQIDQILSVRSEDRREIFEEAAGIKKYRVRKREAERKLEQTEQNLLRVHDIVAEIEARLPSLQRQATAARRYGELAARLRALEDAWFGTRLMRLEEACANRAARLAALRAECAHLERELADAQRAEQAARERLRALEARAEALRAEETAALQRVAAAEAERARAEERAGEIGRRLAVLDRELADLAQRIADQVRRQEQAVREEAALKKTVDSLRRSLAEARGVAEAASAALEAARAEVERLRREARERERREAELKARLRALEARAEAAEVARRRAEEAVLEAEGEAERRAGEEAACRSAAAETEAQLAALAAELETQRGRLREAEERLRAVRAESERATRALQNAAARLQALAELEERGEGAAAGARRLLAAPRDLFSGPRALLVQELRVPEGLERAVEAALGPFGDGVLVASDAEALAALRWLRSQRHDALLLPGHPAADFSPLRNAAPSPAETADDETSPRPLVELLDGSPAALAWARALLDGVILCDTLEEAARLRRRALEELAARSNGGHSGGAHSTAASDPAAATLRPNGDRSPTCHLLPPPSIRSASTAKLAAAGEFRPAVPRLWVTRQGEWLALSGALSSGASAGGGSAGGAAAALLARRREIERLRAEIPALEARAAESAATLRAAETAAREAAAALRDGQARLERARLEAQSRAREAERLRADAARARQRLERLRQELERAEQDAGALRTALEAARESCSASGLPPTPCSPGDLPHETEALAAAEARLRAREAERRAAEQAVADLRVRLAEQEQRLQQALAATRRAVESGAHLDRQRSDRLEEQRRLAAEREQRTLAFAALEAALAAARGAATEAREALAAMAEERSAQEAAVARLRAAAEELSGRLREATERAHHAELERARLDAEREHLAGQWVEAAASDSAGPVDPEASEPAPNDLETLRAAWSPEAAAALLAECSQPEAEIQRLRRQIRSLGPVHPEAVAEYDEARARYEFLTGQRADLEVARAQLESAIAEIDAASRELFLQAFHRIAAAFDAMFRKLFGGGSAELRLTEPGDLLETGVEIVVQPPGKKPQSLSLLSGGERALTAVAMLFALLEVKPSPFCVMDEVDAPLDESNVGRFAAVLREFAARTQFLLVTHNRATMEAADTLYGVTMEERGVSKVLSCTLDDPIVAERHREDGGRREGAGRAAG